MIEDSSKFELTDELKIKIDKILDDHHHDFTQIVGVLIDVQDEIPQHYIPKVVAFYIAEKLPLKLSVIYDCITFYDALSEKPRGRYPIEICDSIACKVNNNEFLLGALKDLLGIDFGTVTYDGRFTIEKVSCFGACDRAPAVRINKIVYGPLKTKEQVRSLLEQFV
ncbi:NAD(P)H-dependent oxidoreductase subunit E [Pectinatus cerevisiiphilus]|uniref:NADH-quinone oxidoreductase subunit E n=1 Tax=Pectinatus cerevisiiphilus TaxID=86956 RepID=A0A4V2US51_9FIRM|nr:NAD(P)H-dependent oxidoreductase subunit E [Pectinatus cerevisiiphilus]TCS80092.1 NADH-quinone oxidoreductase subunit E [Pectinatus cerevisiiphilus]